MHFFSEPRRRLTPPPNVNTTDPGAPEYYHFVTGDPAGLGVSKNKCCRIVPHGRDWVGLVDADVMLLGSWWQIIRAAVASRPDLEIFTCMASRTWQKSAQQMPGAFGLTDLRQLGRIAAETAAAPGPLVTEMPNTASGYYLLFRRWVWDDIPFPEISSQGRRNLGIETDWLRAQAAHGRRVGLIRHLMAIHYYRMGAGSPRDTSHLP